MYVQTQAHGSHRTNVVTSTIKKNSSNQIRCNSTKSDVTTSKKREEINGIQPETWTVTIRMQTIWKRNKSNAEPAKPMMMIAQCGERQNTTLQ